MTTEEPRGRTVPFPEQWEDTLKKGIGACTNPIVRWVKRLNPNATVESTFVHMKREMVELEERIKNHDDAGVAKEAADVLVLAISIISLAGFSPGNAVAAVMRRNGRRVWGPPDADGVVEHLRHDGTPRGPKPTAR